MCCPTFSQHSASLPSERSSCSSGGTALARTHLPDLRLSEDIDLIALGRRSDAARMTTAAVTARLRRSHGDISWRPPLTRTSGSDPATMIIDGRIPIQIQLLASAGQPSWPTVLSPLEQRYSDAAPAQLRTLTPAAFVAAKTMAWVDRAAPRDLYDLWAMRNLNMINSEAAELYRRLGPHWSAARNGGLRHSALTPDLAGRARTPGQDPCRANRSSTSRTGCVGHARVAAPTVVATRDRRVADR